MAFGAAIGPLLLVAARGYYIDIRATKRPTKVTRFVDLIELAGAVAVLIAAITIGGRGEAS